MPRTGAEQERRKALIHAAIEMIGEQGSLDVTVKEIARHAGMSSSLAFHYFGGKDEIIIATMRHLLRSFSSSVVEGLEAATSPSERVDAIITASFTPDQFDRKTVAAWLVFYLKAYSSQEAGRLLHIYQKRLASNLMHALCELTDREHARHLSEGLGALVDGLYIRHGLDDDGADAEAAASLCRYYVSDAIRSRISGDH